MYYRHKVYGYKYVVRELKKGMRLLVYNSPENMWIGKRRLLHKDEYMVPIREITFTSRYALVKQMLYVKKKYVREGKVVYQVDPRGFYVTAMLGNKECSVQIVRNPHEVDMFIKQIDAQTSKFKKSSALRFYWIKYRILLRLI